MKKKSNDHNHFEVLKKLLCNDIYSFKDIGDQFKSDELYDFFLDQAIKYKHKNPNAYQPLLKGFDPHSSYYTKDRILKVLYVDGYMLVDLRKNPLIIDEDICFQALKSHAVSDVIESIPNSVWTENFILRVVNEIVIKEISYDLLAKLINILPEIIKESALEKVTDENPLFLKEIPKSHQFTNMCMKAIKKNPASIKYIKEPTLDMYLEAVSQDKRLKKTATFYNDYTDEELEEIILKYQKRKILLENL